MPFIFGDNGPVQGDQEQLSSCEIFFSWNVVEEEKLCLFIEQRKQVYLFFFSRTEAPKIDYHQTITFLITYIEINLWVRLF